MGGADTANLNIKLLEMLPKKYKIAVVTTIANKNLEDLEEYVKDKKNISLFINSNQIAKLINESRFAIITPSVIVNEVYFMGLPFVAIKTADNQDEIARYLEQQEMIVLNIDEIGKINDTIFNK